MHPITSSTNSVSRHNITQTPSKNEPRGFFHLLQPSTQNPHYPTVLKQATLDLEGYNSSGMITKDSYSGIYTPDERSKKFEAFSYIGSKCIPKGLSLSISIFQDHVEDCFIRCAADLRKKYGGRKLAPELQIRINILNQVNAETMAIFGGFNSSLTGEDSTIKKKFLREISQN